METSNDSPSGAGPRRRLSITQLQRSEAAVAELLCLCQAVTADGVLDDVEIAALRDWLADNSSLDIPARKYLIDVVQSILADGIVTPEERASMYLAIEKVLPPDLRQEVRGVRRAREEEEKARRRRERLEAKEQERQQRIANRRVASWNFMVAGVRFEGRPKLIRDYANPGDPVEICRQPSNRFSKNACAVQVDNGIQIGYVPEEHARELAGLLDQGYKYEAWITKILTGGRFPIPVVQLNVYSPEASLPDLRIASLASNNRQAAREVSCGSAVALGILFVVVLVAIALLVA